MPEIMPTTETAKAPPLHAVLPKSRARKTADAPSIPASTAVRCTGFSCVHSAGRGRAMADKSKIQWCDATINPAYGCSPVSPACDHCYAARMAGRLGRLTAGTHRDGKWTGKINLFPERMEQALRWRKPRRIFIGSMTDLFHPEVPDEFLDQIFACVALAPRHTFLVLTKRPERMRGYFTRLSRRHHTQVLERAAMAMFGEDAANAAGNALDGVLAEGHNVGWPMRNLWLGVTAEDQQRADERIPILLKTPAAIHFVSVEPMLGPVDISTYLGCSWACPECGAIEQHEECHREDDYSYHHCLSCGYTNDNYEPWGGVDELDWVICGGESGAGARPMHPDWARGLRDQCAMARVPFFFKQWGEWAPRYDAAGREWPTRVGKHRAGRLLDGVEWNEFPEVRS